MSVPGLSRGVAILQLFRRDRPSLTAPQIAAELEIPRSTIHRLLVELTELGLVRRDGNARYALDVGVLRLGFEYLGSQDLTTLAAPLLEKLRDATDWSTHLAIRQGTSIVYIARCASRAAVKHHISVGTALPAHSTVMGRVLLADLEPTELRALYAGERFDGSDGMTIPHDLAGLERLLIADRRLGHVAADNYHETGVRAVAAAVRDDSLRVVAAINATTAADGRALQASVVEAVLDTASALSQLLGGPTAPRERVPAMTGDGKWL